MRKSIPVNLPATSAPGQALPGSKTAVTAVPVTLPGTSHVASLTVPSTPSRQPPAEMLDVDIKEKKQLQGIYMPFLTNGGIFVPTVKAYALGEEVYLNLHLLKEPRPYVVIGRVAWISPRNALNKRMQGIGIHFSLDENTGIAKRKIEELLGPAVKSDKSTHTL